MKRYRTMPHTRTYVPYGDLELIVRKSNDYTGEIRQHTTDTRYLPPSIKITSSLKMWLQSQLDEEQNMYLVRGPQNILSVYKGISGSNESITPTGGLASQGGDITYIILDSDNEPTIAPTILNYPEPNHTDHYSIYAIDIYGNTSVLKRFAMKSVTSDVIDNDMIVANIVWNLPNHVAHGSRGALHVSWTITAPSQHDDVYLQVMEVKNIALEPNVAVTNDSAVQYIVNDKYTSIGNKAIIRYRLYNAIGNVSELEEVCIPITANIPPLLDGFVSNMPDEVIRDSTISWFWGGGLDIDGDDMVLDIVSIVGATADVISGIIPGVPIAIHVTGSVGTLLIMHVRLRDRLGVSRSHRITSRIVVKPPNIDNMGILVNNKPIETHDQIYPCDDITLKYIDIVDNSGGTVTISVSSPVPGVTFTTSVFSPDVNTTMHIPCGYDTADNLELNSIISNGVTSVTRTDFLVISPIQGHELVNYSRIFIKPAGVTSLTVVGQGGIGDSTILTGLISHTFQGNDVTATEYPIVETIFFDNLPGDVGAITVTLATNTVLNFHFT